MKPNFKGKLLAFSLGLFGVLTGCYETTARGPGTQGTGAIQTIISSYTTASPTITASGNNLTSTDGTVNTGALNPAQTVTEGDVFVQLKNTAIIANLNELKGLQLVDIANADAPQILAQLPLYGTPVEMYELGDYIMALTNDTASSTSQTLNNSGDELHTEQTVTAMLWLIDISDKRAPKVVDKKAIDGWIKTSRMSESSQGNALYFATTASYSINKEGSAASVYSFVRDGDQLVEKTKVDLGTQVTALQATANHLMVAAGTYTAPAVKVFDISPSANAPVGSLVEGASIAVACPIYNKTNMDVVGNILRTVCHKDSPSANVVQTFNVADITAPIAIDSKSFANNEQLYATLFMADRAFFVTYLRVDPLHTFSISPTGVLKEESEFIVSGWNDYFKPVANNKRMVGVGTNDENNKRKMSVSLYDTNNLTNPNPLLARAEVSIDNSWSNASYDSRAFSVLENATSAIAADGVTIETGLILLPFSGYKRGFGYSNGVQIFTFSANTLTARGIMTEQSNVLRSFLAASGDSIVGNLSQSQLSLFSAANTNIPVLKSRLDLAPIILKTLSFEKVSVRSRQLDNGSVRVELVKPTVNPEIAEVIGTLPDVNAAGSLRNIFKLNNTLVTLEQFNGQLLMSTWSIDTPAEPKKIDSISLDASKLSAQSLFSNMTSRCSTYHYATGQVYDILYLPSTSQCGMSVALNNSLVVAEYKGYYGSENGSTIETFHKLYVSPSGMINARHSVNVLPSERIERVIADGEKLWYSYAVPAEPLADGQKQVKYFARQLDFGPADSVLVSEAINVPGTVEYAQGEQLFTINNEWSGASDKSHQTINRIVVRDGLGYLQSTYALDMGASVTNIQVDGVTVAASISSKNQYSINLLDMQNVTAELSWSILTVNPIHLTQLVDGVLKAETYRYQVTFDYTKAPQAVSVRQQPIAKSNYYPMLKIMLGTQQPVIMPTFEERTAIPVASQ